VANRKETSSPRNYRRSPVKPAPKETGKSKSWPILFWLCFVILLLGLFLVNREAIGNSIETIKNEFGANKTAQPDNPAPPAAEVTVKVKNPAPEKSKASPSSNTQKTSTPEKTPVQPQVQPPPANAKPAAQPAKQPAAEQPAPAQPAKQPPAQTAPAQTAPATPLATASPQAAAPAKTQNQAELRERTLYFIHVDRGGSILREKVSRKLPVSDSPMTDAIQAIIAGPNSDEKQKDLISLIPPNTRILSATVRGDTAYISFSEDFQYNTYGVEGYAAQLRQVVFTATEFPNVKNVQILIEGRRVDYLGEGIWIGSPINRDML